MRTTTNESAERQNITNEPVLETSILTDDELKGVSGGSFARIEWTYTSQRSDGYVEDPNERKL